MKIRALAALLPLLVLGACAEDNNVSMQIFKICAPPESCTFESECELQFIGTNRMDKAQTSTFWSFLEVHNQMVRNEDLSAGRPNTRDAYVEEFTVDYAVAGGAVALPSVTHRIEAGPTMVPAEGSAVVSVLPIPPEVGALIDPAAGAVSVVANVRLRGFLADQSEWETAAYPIPVQVCTGCLAVAACTDTTQSLSVCPQAGQTPSAISCQ